VLRRAAAAASLACCAGLLTREASARPQWSVSGQVGVSGDSDGKRVWQSTRLDLGLRTELLLGRDEPNQLGVGPYVEARTSAFVLGDFGGGVFGLIPIAATYPLWLGAGGFARFRDGAWVGGGDFWLAWGARSYNYTGDYGMAYGLFADARAVAGPQSGIDVIFGVTLDLEALALPFIFLGSAMKR